MLKILVNSKFFCTWLSKSLAIIGGLAVLGAAGMLGLRALRNHAPDSLGEIVSPDGRYRIFVAEELVGFPGQVCVKDAYGLKVGKSLDRNDEESHVYAGACDGLTNIHWVGATVEGTVNISAAIDGVVGVSLRSYGAGGKVRVKWTSNKP